MTFTIVGYTFSGPYRSAAELEDRSGVYVVLTPTDATHFKALDVGESATVKTRITHHERKPCWQRNSNNGQVLYAIHYAPHLQQHARQEVELKIRNQYCPPCGDR